MISDYGNMPSTDAITCQSNGAAARLV